MRGIHVMRTVKILLALLLFAVLAGGVTANSSQAAKKADYEYDTVKGGVEITGYTGKDKNIKIPDKIAGKKVVSIGSSAFRGNTTIKKVTIPDTVESIENWAFEKSGLTQINIPDSVKDIGFRAFYKCKNLKKVHLGKKVKIIKAACFMECTKLLSINLENVEEIQYSAFMFDKSITGVLNLDSVTTINSEAFFRCEGIKEVNFTDTLQILGNKYDNPFAYCTGIKKFTISKENGNYTCVDGGIYRKADGSIVAWPAGKAGEVVLGSNVKRIYNFAFSGAQITSIAMEGEVNYIGEEAFAKSMITEVSMPLPDTSKKIVWKDNAFQRCRKLVKVVFPDKSVSSNKVCFLHCTSLKEVVLPETMTELSEKMFLGCTALESMTIPNAITEIPSGCFFNCSRLKKINLENIEQIAPVAFSHCSSFDGTLTLNVQKIGALSFEKCTGIKEVKFTKPLSKITYGGYSTVYTQYDLDGVSSEANYVLRPYQMNQMNPFAGCTGLTAISVPEGGEIRSIDGVLYSADMKELIAYPAALTGKFNIPYGVERICSFAFQDSALTELVTANSVKDIYYHAVNGSNIKSITISKGVNNIEGRALDGCKQLESIKVHASNSKYESDDGVLYEKIAKGSLLLYPSARKGAKYTVRKKARVASYSFNNCKYLKKVIIPEGIVEDYGEPFYNCKNIKLYFPKSMKSYNDEGGEETDIYPFDKTCRGCMMYAKKNSPLAKYFEKKKVKYKTY